MSVIKDEIFDEVYEPIKNHLDSNAGWSGTLFETYGEQLEFVSQVCREEPKRVWTLVDGDDDMYIVAGMHLVNRVGYIITKKNWVTGEETVPQEMPKSEDEICDECGEEFFELEWHEATNKELCEDCIQKYEDEEE
jgi:hypothetical protein